MKSLDELLSSLEIDPTLGVLILGAEQFAEVHYPQLNPDLGALLLGLETPALIERAKEVLDGVYPPDHPAVLLQSTETSARKVSLGDLDPDESGIALYLPPLAKPSSFEGFQETVAHLRAPDGCPWDQEQTYESLRKHMLEETYEVLEAIDRGDVDDLQEELGDLLLQILMNAQIAYETGHFRMVDVIASIQAKLIRRHPHVFGDVEVSDVDQVLTNWEHFKREEKDDGPLDGVPRSLPGLAQAAELQDRAGRVGFKWPSRAEALAKVHEELAEFVSEAEATRQPLELGDLLFAIVNYARWINADAEAEIRRASDRFRLRFAGLLAAAKEQELLITDLEFDEMMRLWEDTKGLTA